MTARAVVVGCEHAVADTLGHAIGCRPGDRLGEVAVGRDIAELGLAGCLCVQRAGEKRHRLRTGAGGIRAECGGRRAGGDAVLDGPRDSLLIVAAGDHIGHASRGALRLGRAGSTPQEGDDLSAGAGLVRPKEAISDTAGDALFLRPLHSLLVIGAGGHIAKRACLNFLNKGSIDFNLAGGHGKCILTTTLVGQIQFVAVLISRNEIV